MKFKILQEELNQALIIASRYASGKAQLPVLSNILIMTKKNKVIISSTNLEISTSISVGAEIEEEGELTLPAKTITEIVGNLPHGQILMEAKKEQMTITGSNFKTQISGMNSSDYPAVPHVMSDKALTFTREAFADSLSQVIFASSNDETRPVLTGILFIFRDKELILVSTDGFRLSQKRIKLDNKTGDFKVILPKGILSEILRLSQKEGEWQVSFKEGESQAVFSIDKIVLSSRTIQGEFPDFEKIIPKDSTILVDVDKEDFLRAIKLASVFAKESANVVKLKVKKETLEITSENKEIGSQEFKVEAKVEKEGDDLEIAFNFRFLEEITGVLKGDNIIIKLSGPNAPAVFLDPADPNFMHLIMPVRLQV